VSAKKTPEAVWIAAVAVVLLLVAVAGFFLVVSPQRGNASDLTKQIADTQKQIDDARALVAKAKNAQKVKIADIFRLTKAMPDSPDEAGVLLDLNTVAERSGITFDSLSVDPSTTLTNYQVIPLRLEFHGNFYDLADFLFRLRNLVDVHRGALDARGRLFAVDKIALDEGVYVFPQIRAQITVVAFVYGSGVPGSAAPPQSASAGGATTTSSATTTPPSSAAPAGNATASGATP
jgi:Pilus assembly protein, PilO